MMNKYTLSGILILTLLSALIFAIIEMFIDGVPLEVWVVVSIPFIIGIILIGLLRDLIPLKKLRAIRTLAEDVRLRVKESLTPIDMPDAPEEITPLINSINQLMSYYEDRYKQERDFTANASHELRSPLAGIRLQTEIAIKTHVAEKRDKALRNVLKSVDRGTRLVEQLLVLSRLTADRVDLVMEAVNLGRVSARVVAEYHSGLAAQKHIDLHMGEWNSSIIEASEPSIEIMIDNLVRNALTYTPKGGKAEVAVSHMGKHVVLTVTDDGLGIPKEKREQVFRRFEKANRGTKTGTGLGLSIVKRIAELHGATLELGDGDNGKGLKVTVTFDAYENSSPIVP